MGEIAGLQPRSSDVPQDDGFTYMDGSAVRHIVQGLSEFVHSPRQWLATRRVGGTALGETVGPDGITQVTRDPDELTYQDFSAVRQIANFGRRTDR